MTMSLWNHKWDYGTESIQFTTFPAFSWYWIYYGANRPARLWWGCKLASGWYQTDSKIWFLGLFVEILMISNWNGSGCFCFWVPRQVLLCVGVCVRAQMFSFSNSDPNPPPRWLRRSPSVLPFFPQAKEIVKSSNGESGGRKEWVEQTCWRGRMDGWIDGWMDGWEEWVDEVRREQCGSEGGGGGRMKAQIHRGRFSGKLPLNWPTTDASSDPSSPARKQSQFLHFQ